TFQDFFEKAAAEATGEQTPAVGLIYIEGVISPGESEDDPFLGSGAGSTTIRYALDRARKDDNIKAVVVRVDSPGGSALASDIIWIAATRCAAVKPVIVSMGQVAGSGGYYVSVGADTIFADPTTITGSIGVVGGKLVLRDLLQSKLGITTAEFVRGKHAGLMTSMRPWTESERAWVQRYMQEVYDQFKARITKARGQRLKKDLEEMAGGRVYTGAQALELGLVDKLGGLHDALQFAAEKGGLGKDFEVRVLPKPSGLAALFDMLRKLSGGDERDEYEIGLAQLRADPLLRTALPVLGTFAPGELRETLRFLQNLLILRNERVGCFMPFVPELK
ncbi:MAG: signal peptide peptidase SppA, partial [Planctomycetota bacterium]